MQRIFSSPKALSALVAAVLTLTRHRSELGQGYLIASTAKDQHKHLGSCTKSKFRIKKGLIRIVIFHYNPDHMNI